MVEAVNIIISRGEDGAFLKVVVIMGILDVRIDGLDEGVDSVLRAFEVQDHKPQC